MCMTEYLLYRCNHKRVTYAHDFQKGCLANRGEGPARPPQKACNCANMAISEEFHDDVTCGLDRCVRDMQDEAEGKGKKDGKGDPVRQWWELDVNKERDRMTERPF